MLQYLMYICYDKLFAFLHISYPNLNTQWPYGSTCMYMCSIVLWTQLDILNASSSTANKQPAKEHAAVWVPDCDANTCMHCLKTKFTPINRRVSVWVCVCVCGDI